MKNADGRAHNMADTVLDIMRARYRTLMRTIQSLEKARSELSEGSIHIKTHKGRQYFYCYSGQGEKYLSKKDSELIRQLVQKEQIEKAINAAKIEAKTLEKDIISYPKNTFEKAYYAINEAYLDYASPLTLNDKEYVHAWLTTPFAHKPFGKDVPKFYSIGGERVRSKSEVIIADRLYIKSIPYKYECPVRIGKKVIHPDFTILRLSDKKIVYHEHCGMMGDHGYVNDMLERVNDYAHAGVFAGDRLFFTFESEDHPLDISWLDDFIEKNYR